MCRVARSASDSNSLRGASPRRVKPRLGHAVRCVSLIGPCREHGPLAHYRLRLCRLFPKPPRGAPLEGVMPAHRVKAWFECAVGRIASASAMRPIGRRVRVSSSQATAKRTSSLIVSKLVPARARWRARRARAEAEFARHGVAISIAGHQARAQNMPHLRGNVIEVCPHRLLDAGAQLHSPRWIGAGKGKRHVTRRNHDGGMFLVE